MRTETRSPIPTAIGAAVGAALMVVALRAWGQASHWAFNASRPEVVQLGIRAAAIAIAALAQAILLTFVLGARQIDNFGYLLPRRRFDQLLRIATALIFGVAIICAAALGWAGK